MGEILKLIEKTKKQIIIEKQLEKILENRFNTIDFTDMGATLIQYIQKYEHAVYVFKAKLEEINGVLIPNSLIACIMSAGVIGVQGLQDFHENESKLER